MRVGVIGAGGRLGTVACRALAAADGIELVAAVQPNAAGRDLGDLVGVGGGVTVQSEVADLADAVDAAVEVTARADEATANVLIVPNFALGAVLLQQFAEQAARHFPDVEIVELHHDGKADAPSGTALATAQRIDEARALSPAPVGGDDDHPGARGHTHHGVPVHSVRLPGLVAHQEVLFGGGGELLTIRHDSMSRDSFAAGIVLAVRGVADLDGVTIGLDTLLG